MKTNTKKGKSGLDGKVRRWMLRVHPEEREMIGDFSATVTWRELARRMLAGENFYDVCSCTESTEREYAFQRMAELFGTGYDFWYLLWRDGTPSCDRKTKARVLAQIGEGA